MNMHDTITRAIALHGKAVLVSVVDTKGSVPREKDAWMLVTPDGFHGTIGGGTLEWKAMAQAQKLLQHGEGRQQTEYVLGPDLGQCCGGRVRLAFQVLDAQSHIPNISEFKRSVMLFGAGHVGRALVLSLAPLPFDIQWIDPRPNAFPTHVPANTTLVQPDDCVAALQDGPDGALVFVMTHSHTLDLAIVDAALRQANIAHVGLIGSATKRARFEKRLREAGVENNRISELICPIGISGIVSKHPAAIAAGVAAQILQLDSALTAYQAAELKKAVS
jgi:xanthine dehydrogenase accessory factor